MLFLVNGNREGINPTNYILHKGHISKSMIFIAHSCSNNPRLLRIEQHCPEHFSHVEIQAYANKVHVKFSPATGYQSTA